MYLQKHIYYRYHLWQTTNTVSLGTVILCINIGLKINYTNTCETPQGQDWSITNTALKCIWTGIEIERTDMFWKRELPSISNQHYWTLDCNCLNTVDSVSTMQVYSHKETFVSDGWIVEGSHFHFYRVNTIVWCATDRQNVHVTLLISFTYALI